MLLHPLRPGAVALVALLLLPPALQGRMISGDLTDPNGYPVAGATVEVVENGASTISDALGQYRLDNVPDGTFTVRVTSEDFEPVEVEGNGEASSLPIQVTEIKRNRATVEVVATLEDLRASIPGSLHLVSKEDLTAAKPIDANEVLRRIPGVNLREDSGPAAMRLNIGMRGLNPNRSRKVLMLEDGIPIALAPYGEPDMYYSPPIERMSRVEVLKGSGQIAHGPQTIGGLVNFVTPEPPSKFHGEVDLESGQRGLFVGQASLGGSNRDQSMGWITNYLHKQGDGWRQFYYDIEDVQTKFSLRPNESHAIALKAGLYDEISNSTYVGLTTPMFEANPDQNPVPSDALDVERLSGSLSHSYTISPNAVLSSTGFLYSTKRFWGRQDFDRSDRGRDYLGIAGDPSVPRGSDLPAQLGREPQPSVQRLRRADELRAHARLRQSRPGRALHLREGARPPGQRGPLRRQDGHHPRRRVPLRPGVGRLCPEPLRDRLARLTDAGRALRAIQPGTAYHAQARRRASRRTSISARTMASRRPSRGWASRCGRTTT